MNLLNENDAKELLARFGLSRPSFVVLEPGSEDCDINRALLQSRLTFPLVAKIQKDGLAHKTELGGVRLNIKDVEELREVLRDMNKRFPGSRVLAEEFVPHQLEFILGISQDRDFGNVLMFGTGGILAELYQDVVFRKLPLGPGDLEAMLNSVKIGQVFRGFRGLELSVRLLDDLVHGLQGLVDELGDELKELDINPLVYSQGRFIALDAKLMLG